MSAKPPPQAYSLTLRDFDETANAWRLDVLRIPSCRVTDVRAGTCRYTPGTDYEIESDWIKWGSRKRPESLHVEFEIGSILVRRNTAAILAFIGVICSALISSVGAWMVANKGRECSSLPATAISRCYREARSIRNFVENLPDRVDPVCIPMRRLIKYTDACVRLRKGE